MVVSDRGLDRHRLGKALRRAGLDPAAALDPWAAADEMGRREWDVVVWAAAGAGAALAREMADRTPPPPLLLVPPDGAGAEAVVAGLAAGFADVASPGAGRAEVVARARAVASRSVAARAAAQETGAFRELAEGGRDMLARQAPDGTIRWVSGAAREILAWEPDDLLGRRAPDILPLEALEAAPSPLVHRVRRRDGGWAWMETTARPLHDAAGRLREVHTDSRDVSERVRAERERAALSRVTAAVAEGADFADVAALVAREAAGLAGAEDGAVVRFHGDEGMVIGAWGPELRAGDRLPMAAAGRGGIVAPVSAEGRPWGAVLARGLDPSAGIPTARERLALVAPLVGLAVTNARARERLVAMATTDPLTGLANHGAFHRRLEEECARAARSGAPLSLVLIDLDHFKRVNDTHGHQAGDEVLREVARRLASAARRGDVTARVGGEELAWLLPEAGLGEALEAAERLRAAIAGTPFPVVGRQTASLGVAERGGGGPADLTRWADLALYRAKEGGRDACVPWTVMEALFE